MSEMSEMSNVFQLRPLAPTAEQNLIFLFDFGLLGRKFWVLFGVKPGFVRFGVEFGAKISVLYGDISTPNKT